MLRKYGVIMRRLENYNKIISKKIRTKKNYAKGFLEGLMEDMGEDKGLSLEEALKLIIRTMGIKEFAKFTKQKPPNVVDFLKGRRQPKQSTFDAYLKPFGLKTYYSVKAA